ncbi:acetyl-CoA carboxylase, carboxyl transferase subunit beta [Thermincola ferriacetica]|uniref:Acetyl-coenzyme A carboxylase carboxyl transferase subunit beta n=2 Tax=Thermincola TaxID=278993 RepID=D5XA36_THEPJ|nr:MULTISPECIES: acetyl-CoA carboxylase, carboxyltransferase subunit beta [Thermincola]ADG83169.1 acetyl-CoA carboxylase, carboxyl transferase, beta subunit [Thermincola potens JR]KNZ68284.1 acetyl-CoA carboxylase, carboxyl transferase subunit beta [Thermincola ferriacetica]
MLKDLFRKPKYVTVHADTDKKDIPEGLWQKCPQCNEILYTKELGKLAGICPKCKYHFRLGARERLAITVDEGTFVEFAADLQPANPLNFPGYPEKITAAREKTGLNEAIVVGTAKIEGHPTVIGVMDANFIMGSMGSVVGEKVTRAIEKAIEEKLPLIMFCASGGARMQEGILSLMQMAKTSAALNKMAAAGLLYITVLTDPTTGGVTASFASLGDIIIGEPGALIGFAGPRVIEQAIKKKLPEGFQTSEFLLEHGFVDIVVPRSNMKQTLAGLLELHKGGGA